MRRPRLRLVLGIAIPLLLVIAFLAAWSIDASATSGKVPRNVTLSGRDISKLPEDDLAATVADIAEEWATTEVQVRTDGRTYKATASELGLRLDQEATVQAALDLDEDRSLLSRPFVWAASFLDERRAPLEFIVDPEVMRTGLAELGGDANPTEPSIVATADGFGIVSGSAGTRIGGDDLADQLEHRAEASELPLVIDAETVEQAPTVSDEDARALAERLSTNTAEGLAVTAGEQTTTVAAATVRAWVGSEVVDGRIEPTIDPERAVADLEEALPATTEAKDASITVEGGAVKLTPAVQGTACCAADTPTRLLAAIAEGGGRVEVALEVTEPEFTTAEAEALGIKEPVGTTTEWKGQTMVKRFTTFFTAGQPRNTNIRLIAEAVKGTIIEPGESFSMNEVAGQRTADKGYVEAGAIANGELVQEVGGGVSQFATTMFNAAFFAGLPIDTYQMHSQYFDRYPFGREATMGFPNPDLVWTNDTPYGILVWTESTDTSVTVILYSTQHAFGEQTGQTTGRSGNCTTVSTTRTIRYPDGRSATDTFNARYRDEGQTTC